MRLFISTSGHFDIFVHRFQHAEGGEHFTIYYYNKQLSTYIKNTKNIEKSAKVTNLNNIAGFSKSLAKVHESITIRLIDNSLLPSFSENIIL